MSRKPKINIRKIVVYVLLVVLGIVTYDTVTYYLQKFTLSYGLDYHILSLILIVIISLLLLVGFKKDFLKT